MYICHCNSLTDDVIRDALARGAACPRDVYAACECRAQCGGCTATILCMIRDDADCVAPRTALAA